MLPITAVLASLLSVLLIWLSIQVIKRRRQLKVLIGTGDKEELEWAIRAQGNFSEYVPIALILFAIAEFNKTDWRLLIVFAAILVHGRLLHAYGFLYARDRLEFRVKGMKLTFLAIFILSIWNLGFVGYQMLAN
ncbi:MAG: glutathione S-transferase [Pseudomonadota bacterium]|jgi:uncharacterized membrane protein YecN with MAPEG domain